MSFSANEDRRPGIVDAKLQDVIDDTDIYSGAAVPCPRCVPLPTTLPANKGVAFGLQNVQKLRDDDPAGNRHVPPARRLNP